MPVFALTIAASDPSGGAGIEMDLKVFQAHGVYGLSAITALTVQSSRGLFETHPVDPEVFEKILDELADDLSLNAIKIGVVANVELVEAVSRFLLKVEGVPVVLDPVMRSSSGRSLVEPGTEVSIRELLVARAAIVTPNLEEAGVLAGMDVRTRDDMRRACEVLGQISGGSVLLKGGHLEGEAVDVFYHEGEIEELAGSRIPGEYHGTGCALSAGIAARLALGEELGLAVNGSREYLRGLLGSAFSGSGDVFILFPENI
jgi:hydroxymethylpyrimidine/phosphomethylpyrimidine kinase